MADSMNINGIPGAGAMGDTLELVRNFWGAMKIPGMAMPSMSPDDINKQIADLKAVESWLQMNMNMLRSTIQTLEVQSATLSALQSMSDSFAKATKPSASSASGYDKPPPFESPFVKSTESEADTSAPDPAAFAAQFANPATWWNTVQEQFSQAVTNAMAPEKKSKSARNPAAKSAAKSSTKSATTAKKRSAAPRKPSSAKK